MANRYFARWNGGRLIGICRLAIDDKEKTLLEQAWTKNDQWEPTGIVMRGLMSGDVDLDEITEDKARELFPDAFALASRKPPHRGAPASVWPRAITGGGAPGLGGSLG